jgi:hypothetical protein
MSAFKLAALKLLISKYGLKAKLRGHLAAWSRPALQLP